MKLNLRYKGKDKYNYPIFTANKDNADENMVYDKLVKINEKMNILYPGNHSPIFKSDKHDYVNITYRCIPPEIYDESKLLINGIYEIETEFYNKEWKGKKIYNVYANKINYIGMSKSLRGDIVIFDDI